MWKRFSHFSYSYHFSETLQYFLHLWPGLVSSPAKIRRIIRFVAFEDFTHFVSPLNVFFFFFFFSFFFFFFFFKFPHHSQILWHSITMFIYLNYSLLIFFTLSLFHRFVFKWWIQITNHWEHKWNLPFCDAMPCFSILNSKYFKIHHENMPI